MASRFHQRECASGQFTAARHLQRLHSHWCCVQLSMGLCPLWLKGGEIYLRAPADFRNCLVSPRFLGVVSVEKVSLWHDLAPHSQDMPT